RAHHGPSRRSRFLRQLVSIVDALTDFRFQLRNPGAWIHAVDNPAEKPQSLCDITAIVPDVLLRGADIGRQELLHGSGFGKQVGRVTQLWSFDDGSLFKIENVLF